MRTRVIAGLCLVAGSAIAAPTAEQRYEGSRLSVAVPAGSKVSEVSDVAADWALDIVPPPQSPLAGMRLSLLVSNAQTRDGDIEAQGTVWRDKRLRNRASWGVPASGGRKVDDTHVGAHRAVRFVDELQSQMGGRQVMLCIAALGHLTCAVGSGPADSGSVLEQALSALLDSVKPHR